MRTESQQISPEQQEEGLFCFSAIPGIGTQMRSKTCKAQPDRSWAGICQSHCCTGDAAGLD